MAGFISDSEKASLAAVFKSAMETFFVPIYVYVSPEVVVVTEDPNYNRFDASDENNLTPRNIPILHVVSGRVQYGSDQPTIYATTENNKVSLPEGKVRIKIDASGAALLSKAKEIELDGGYRFINESTPRPHGIFSGTYTTFFLRKVE
jgi:hypothetical protein